MPLFDLEDGARAEPVTTMRPDDASFGQVLSVVLEHLPTLLGERLFMTVGRDAAAAVLGDGAADVLAIDAAGDPVVVQAVPLLAAQHLVVALRGAGRASGVTRRALAASYAQGPDRFHSDLASFFDHDGAPRATGSGRTARLVLVCAEIDDDAVEAVSFLSVDAARVQVLTVGVVEGASGRRLLDVSSLRPGELGARQTVSLEMGTPDGAGDVVPEHTAGEVAETGPTPAEPQPQPLSAFGRSGPQPARPAPAALRERSYPVYDSPPHDREPVEAAATSPAPPSATPALSAPTAATPLSDTDDARGAAGAGDAVDARLALVARTLSAPLDLVWVRHRRGERLEVVLGLDGLLHAPDGVSYSDPDAAVQALSGSASSNGWRVWRAGESGPSLDELVSDAQESDQP